MIKRTCGKTSSTFSRSKTSTVIYDAIITYRHETLRQPFLTTENRMD